MKDTGNKSLVSIWCAGKKNPDLCSLFEGLKDSYHFDVDASAWGEHGTYTKSAYDNILFVIHIDKDDDVSKMKESYERYAKVMEGHKSIMTSNSEAMRNSMPDFNVDNFVNISQLDKAKPEIMSLLDKCFPSGGKKIGYEKEVPKEKAAREQKAGVTK